MLKKGYTLVELIAVISVIGTLASIATPTFTTLALHAKNIKAGSEVRTLQTIVERYRDKQGCLPDNLDLKSFSREINITRKNIYDPYQAEKGSYGLQKIKLSDGTEAYVIFSKGLNGEIDFKVQNREIIEIGDDIIASDLLMANIQ